MMPQPPEPPAAPSGFEFEALDHARNYRQALVGEFTRFLQGNVLEVGAGVGQMTRLLIGLPAVQKVLAVEPDPRFHERLSHVIPEPQVIKGGVEQVQEGAWNAIVCVNVLEHIADDLAQLVAFYSLLKQQQGYLCLFVPARQELYAPIDRDFGHYRRYNRPGLAAKLRHARFSVVRVSYFNAPGYFLWWLNFKLLKNRRFDPAKVLLFDRFLFPLIHAVESKVVRPPFGQSLLAVAQAVG
jgi:SAM-dependent methyltransferase